MVVALQAGPWAASSLPTGDWLPKSLEPFVSVELDPTSTAKKQARPAPNITSARWPLAIFTTNKSQKGERLGKKILQNGDGDGPLDPDGRIAKPSPNPPSGTSRRDGTEDLDNSAAVGDQNGGRTCAPPSHCRHKLSRPSTAAPVRPRAMTTATEHWLSVHEWHQSTIANLAPCYGHAMPRLKPSRRDSGRLAVGVGDAISPHAWSGKVSALSHCSEGMNCIPGPISREPSRLSCARRE